MLHNCTEVVRARLLKVNSAVIRASAFKRIVQIYPVDDLFSIHFNLATAFERKTEEQQTETNIYYQVPSPAWKFEKVQAYNLQASYTG